MPRLLASARYSHFTHAHYYSKQIERIKTLGTGTSQKCMVVYMDSPATPASASSSAVALKRYAERALVEPDLELEIGVDMKVSPQMFRRLVKVLRSECGPAEDTLQMDVDRRSEVRNRDARLEFLGRPLIEAALASCAKGPTIGPGTVTPTRVLVKNRENPTIAHEDFDYKIKLKREIDVTDEEAERARAMDPGAHFRVKRRFSFRIGVCRVDCTVVQERLAGDPSTQIPFKYEVEVEFVDRESAGSDPDLVVDEMTRIARHCVCVMLGNSSPPTRKERAEVLAQLASAAEHVSEAGAELMDGDQRASGPETESSAGGAGTGRRMNRLSGPQPVTLMRQQAQIGPDGKAREDECADAGVCLETIWSGAYTVTDKADGMRCQLYVHQGTAYTIDSALSVRRCAIDVPQALSGTWLDGELVTSHSAGSALNLFAAFDIYRLGRRPVASLPLMSGSAQAPDRRGDDRLTRLQEAVASLERARAVDAFQVSVKRFELVDSAGRATRRLLDEARTQRVYETDGLIFTPAYLAVGARYEGDGVHLDRVWPQTLKWKEPSQNTIDFLVRYRRSPGSSGDSDRPGRPVPGPDGTTCFEYELFASYVPLRWEPVDVSRFIQFGDRAFPSKAPRARRFDLGGTGGDILYAPVDARGRPVCADGEPIYPDTIVECAWLDGRWQPVRPRPEKSMRLLEDGIRAANDWGTALGVWKTIVEPVTVSMIERLEHVPPPDPTAGPDGESMDRYYAQRDFGRTRSVLSRMADFHNRFVKAHLYREAAQASSAVGSPALFEMACGKGGDLNRWLDNDFSPVVGIDLSLDNIVNAVDGVYARLHSRGITPAERAMVFAQMDASTRMRPPLDDVRYAASGSPHGDVITALWDASKRPLTSTALSPFRGLVQRGFDVVSCQFAVHYLFENDLVLDRFLSNVDYLLRPGGVFIGTCFDGDALARELEGASGGTIRGNVGSHRAWEITRRYSGAFGGTTGAAVDVFIETINQTATEYLVSPRLLKTRMAGIGMHPVFVKPFSDMFGEKDVRDLKMSEPERALSRKYMMFAFRRAKPDVETL